MVRAIRSRKPVHVPDMLKDKAYQLRAPLAVSVVEIAGIRTLLTVPLLKEDEAIGVVTIYRREVRPFTNKQIELVQNFASQAVIAIENTRLLNELRQRTDDLTESLDQQTATSEVLKVISSSPGELKTVFQTLLENATRICEAAFGSMLQREGDVFRRVALHNAPAAFAEFHSRAPLVDPRKVSDLKRVVETKQVVHVADTAAEHPDAPIAKYAGGRTLLIVPMLKDEELIGIVGIYRQEVRPFSDKQIEIVKNFASQAVIAIENTRLLSELRELLQQQTATTDVLTVISSSPGELEPVFKAMLESALRICEAKFGMLMLHSGDGSFDTRVMVGAPPALVDALLHRSFTPPPGNPLDRMLRTKKAVHVVDAAAEKAKPLSAQLAGARTHISVPMVKQNEVVGAIAVYRTEVRPFTDKQIELVSNFAAQAVIAIENTRLLSELRESLQQQTATADVLKVISRSTFDLQTVLDTLTESAARLCDADMAAIAREKAAAFYYATSYGFPADYLEFVKNIAHPVDRRSTIGRTMIECKPVQISDVLSDREYGYLESQKRGGFRTMLGVPLLREGVPIGVLLLARSSIRPFSPRQIELVSTFADQAVIAIENTRLFEAEQQRGRELSESLQQQTATADVLKVISSSAGELQPVFKTMLAKAVELCEASFGAMWLVDGEGYRTAAMHGDLPQAYVEQWRGGTMHLPKADIPMVRAIRSRKTVRTPDMRKENAYVEGDPLAVSAADIGGIRTLVTVPMLKEGEAVGVITIYRREVRPFTDKQIELVQNFAAQAVIAIENARLLNELRQRTDDLSESLEQQTATSDVLRVISSSPTNVQPVFDSIAESAVRLCDGQFSFVLRFDGKVMDFASCCGLSAEGLDAFHSILPMPASEDTASGRAVVRRAVVEIPDVEADPSYGAQGQGLAKAVIYRSIAAVPLLNEGNPIGAIAVARANAGSFPKRQIVLLQAFADQAVIAIKNVRLFDEVQARTRDLAKSLEELRSTQDRLVQTQKLALLGQLTAGIAHEIKNPLNFVNNFSGVSSELIDELQDTLKGIQFNDKARSDINELTDTLRSNLEKVVQHGKRADAIVKNMLQHSREGSGEHRVVDINALVEESLNLAWHGARAEKQGFDIALERSFDPSTGEADIFPQDITRALLNVISNGFYAATQRKAEMSGGNTRPLLSHRPKALATVWKSASVTTARAFHLT